MGWTQISLCLVYFADNPGLTANDPIFLCKNTARLRVSGRNLLLVKKLDGFVPLQIVQYLWIINFKFEECRLQRQPDSKPVKVKQQWRQFG